MPASPFDLFVQRNIVRRWKAEVTRTQEEVVVLSPYVTSPTAHTVLAARQAGLKCRLFTLFNADLFLSGASSASTLRRLKSAGVALFAVTDLHAKIIIAMPHFASIGSQNLTASGTIRREASVAITDPKSVRQIYSEIQPWCDSSVEITDAMLDEMLRGLPRLKKKRKLLRQETDKLDHDIRVSEKARRLAAELQAKLAEQQSLEALRESTTRIWEQSVQKSRARIRANVARPQDNNGNWHTILRPTAPYDMTRWSLEDGSTIRFDRLNNYLCMIHGSWRLGFARVGQTRIRFVGRTIHWFQPFTIGGEECHVVFNANWTDSNAPNMACDIKLIRLGGAAHIEAWFRLSGMEIQSITVTKDDPYKHVQTWAESNRKLIADDLLKTLLQSFSYKRPTSAGEAATFFGQVGNRYYLQAGRIAECPLLIATPR